MNVTELLKKLTLEEKAILCAGDDFWHTPAIERLGIPSMMMCDGPHGLRKQEGAEDHLGLNESVKAVCFPSAAALAASFDRELMERLGTALANECQAEHVGMLLGPGMNIKRNPLCGRNFEYFSEDPYLTGELAAAYVNALQKGGISTCAKHFAANNQEKMRMSGSSNVDERTLHEIYLAGFEKMVRKSAPHSMMCSYNQINGTFSSENKELLTDILREAWGFEGCVVTDWGAGKNRIKGLLAGLDLEMPGPGTGKEKIIEAVTNGTLDIAVVDQAVKNVLELVSWASEHHSDTAVFDRNADHDLSGEIAAECGVLLKNDDQVLPLSKTAKIAFIGAFAENPRYQGSGSSHINASKVTSPLDAASDYKIVYAQGYSLRAEETDEALLEQALAAAKESDAAVIFAGLPASLESEGFDRSHMDIPANQNALIEAVAEVNRNTVVVLYNGAPVEMPWIDKVAAVLEMYLGGECVGKATVQLLFGDKNPSGKLAESFPVSVKHNPSYLFFPGEGDQVEYREGIFVGYRYYDTKELPVLFPFGHGLSYTQFAYRDLKVSDTHITDQDTVKVSCKVKNTGKVFGKETVQLYISDLESKVRRPIHELKGFVKIALEPGEEKEVSFLLDKHAFAYYETKVNDWFVESGEFEIAVAASSRDIRLTGKIIVDGTIKIPVIYTENSSVGEILASKKGMQVLGAMLGAMQSRAAGENEADSEAQKTGGMGEGGEEMGKAMLNDMPLSALAGFAGLSEEQVQGIVAALNSEE